VTAWRVGDTRYLPLGAAIRGSRLASWTRISGYFAGWRRGEGAGDGGRSAGDQARAPRTGRQAQPSASRRITAAERNAVYEQAAREARTASAYIRRCSVSDPAMGADTAWATADVLRICGRVLRNPALHRAADAYDRAARMPYGRIPRCTYAGDRLRLLARRLVTLGPTVNIGYANDLAVSLAMLTRRHRGPTHGPAPRGPGGRGPASRRAPSRRPDAQPARVWTDNGARARLR
jgi:hypothetical protein